MHNDHEKTSLFLYLTLSFAGQKIDTNLLSSQLSLMVHVGSAYLNHGQEAKRLGTMHPNVWYVRHMHAWLSVYFETICYSTRSHTVVCNILNVMNSENILSHLSRRFGAILLTLRVWGRWGGLPNS